jgi:hypothetical protein
MPTLSITRNYPDDSVLDSQLDLDVCFGDIETFINTTLLSAANIQDSGVDADNIASIAVTTAKFANDSVTADKLSADAADNSLRAVTTNHIRDAAITAGKCSEVLRGKLPSVGQQTASGTDAGYSSGSYTDVTGLTIDITTEGRPVWVQLVSDDAAGGSSAGHMLFQADFSLAVLRDATVIAEHNINGTNMRLPPGVIKHFDAPASGTYTYKVQIKRNSGSGAVNFINVKLVAWEIQ